MIYLDNSATTRLCDAAKSAIIEHIDMYGNPSSQHELGRQSRMVIEDARERIAKCINAEPDQIFFTSGGSEANTWALNYKFVLASPIEHHSVRVDYKLPINKEGIVDPQSISNQVNIIRRNNYFLTAASCVHVNNEIGTIQDIKTMATMAHQNGLQFHVDAVQSIGHIPIDVKEIDCDTMSASGHKFNSLKGTGFLFVQNESTLGRLINGGHQERGMRPGTENVIGIISMAAALEDAVEHMEERNEYVRTLRDKLLNRLLEVDGAHLNGSSTERSVSNINIRFDGISGSQLVTLCSLHGICISSGSACNEGEATPSHVLKAIGLLNEEALNSVRITLGYENTEDEINKAADIITALIRRIRDNEK